MKLCFSTLGCPELSFDEVLAFSKRFEIPALEVRGILGVLDNGQIPEFSPERTEETRQKFADAGVRPWVLGTSCSFHNQARHEKAMIEGKTAIEIAQRLGFKAIRVFGDSVKDGEAEAVRSAANGIAALCDVARGTGVDVLLEVHGDFNTESRLLPVAEACKDKGNFGLIWDIFSTHKTYGDRWEDFYSVFAPYIRHVHLKDIKGPEHALPGQGELPIVPIVNFLCDHGYDGCFSLEWEKKWHPELPPLEPAMISLLKTLK